VSFEKIGLGGELIFEVEQAVVAMTAVSERFRQMGESAKKIDPPVETLQMKLKVLGQEGVKSIGQMASGVKDLGKALGRTLALFSGVTILMKKGADESMEFEQKQAELAASTDATAEDLNRMSFAAKKLGAEFGKSPVAALGMMKNLRASGATIDQTMTSAASAMSLARATGMEEAKAAMFLGQTVKGMGMSFEDSNRIVDVMAKTSAKSGIEINQLGASLRMVSPIARSLGIPFEQVNASLGILSQAGIKGSRAGMGLATMFRALTKPTTASQEILASWGIALTDTQGKLLPLSTIIPQLNKKISGISNASKRAEVSTTIFGRRGEQAFGMLAVAGEKGMKDFENALYGSAGAAGKMAEVRGNNALSQMKKFWTSVKTLSGEVMEPFLTSTAANFKSMFNWVSGVTLSLISIREIGLEEFVKQSEQAGGSLTTVQKIAIGIYEALEELKASFDRVVESAKSFGLSFFKSIGVDSTTAIANLVTKVALIGGALVPVTAAVVAVGWAISKTVFPAFTGIWNLAAGFASLVTKTVLPAIGAMYSSLVTLGGTTITFTGVVGGLKAAVLGVGTAVKGALLGSLKAVFTFLKGWGGPIFLVFGLLWSYLESTGKKFDSFSGMLGGIWEGLKNTFGAFVEGFMSKVGSIWDGVSKLVSAVGKMFNTLFGWLWESNSKAGGDMVSVWGTVGEFIGTVISTIIEGLGIMFELLDEFVTKARTSLQEYMLGVQERALESDRDAMSQDEYEREKRKLDFIKSGIEKDTRSRNLQFMEEKAKRDETISAAKTATETKLAGKKPSDKVNVDVNLGKQETSIKNTLCIDGKQVATAISRTQTEIMERSGAKKEAYQKTASREFGITPGLKKIATLP